VVAAAQVRVVVENAGVQHRDRDAIDPLAVVPGCDGIDRRGLGRLQVPLAVEQRVVGNRGLRVTTAIQGDVFDLRIGTQPLEFSLGVPPGDAMRLASMVSEISRLSSTETPVRLASEAVRADGVGQLRGARALRDAA
jgi:hypothetical protein